MPIDLPLSKILELFWMGYRDKQIITESIYHSWPDVKTELLAAIKQADPDELICHVQIHDDYTDLWDGKPHITIWRKADWITHFDTVIRHRNEIRENTAKTFAQKELMEEMQYIIRRAVGKAIADILVIALLPDLLKEGRHKVEELGMLYQNFHLKIQDQLDSWYELEKAHDETPPSVQ